MRRSRIEKFIQQQQKKKINNQPVDSAPIQQ